MHNLTTLLHKLLIAVPTIPAFSSTMMKLLIVFVLFVIIGFVYFILQDKSIDTAPAAENSADSSESESEAEADEPVESIIERKENDEDIKEGFYSGSGSGAGVQSTGGSGSGAGVQSTGGSGSGVQSTGGSGSGPYNPVADQRATLNDLKTFIDRINTEITRLKLPQTTDAVTTRRIQTYESIKGRVQSIIDSVNKKSITESQIPIMKSQIDATFTAISTDSKLPDIFEGSQLDNLLKGLLPGNLNNDPEVNKTIIDYLKSMGTNLSWYFGFKYTSDAEKKAAEGYNRRAGQAGDDEPDFYADNFNKAAGGYDHQPDGFGTNSSVTDEFAGDPHQAGRGPAGFDWKARSDQICKAIKGRGDDPRMFACMPEGTEVSKDFSYRGYTQMICTRALAVADSGYGDLIGCPPFDWVGWRDQGFSSQ